MTKLQSTLLNEYHSTHTHFFFTRTGDVNTPNNCNTAANSFDVSYILKVSNQVHSSNVVTVHTQQDDTQNIDADALVTNVPKVILGIKTADCVPILLFDFQNKVIAAIHAGWRGAYAGIIANTVTAMTKLRANPNSTIAGIGPCIRQSNYEIDKELRERILQQAEKSNKALYYKHTNLFKPSVKEKHYLFDLPKYCILLLNASGITLIDDINIDTFSNPELLFSFRRAKLEHDKRYPSTGRQLSVIALK